MGNAMAAGTCKVVLQRPRVRNYAAADYESVRLCLKVRGPHVLGDIV